MPPKQLTAQELDIAKRSGPSRTTNLILIGVGLLSIGGAIGFIVWVLNEKECEVNGDCESGICSDNECVQCLKDQDCNPGLICSDKKCGEGPTVKPGCSQDSDCTAEQPVCTSGKCNCTEASCKSKGEQFVCDETSGACVDTTPPECSSNSDCNNYFKKCADGVCENDLRKIIGLVIGGLAGLFVLLFYSANQTRKNRNAKRTKVSPNDDVAVVAETKKPSKPTTPELKRTSIGDDVIGEDDFADSPGNMYYNLPPPENPRKTAGPQTYLFFLIIAIALIVVNFVKVGTSAGLLTLAIIVIAYAFFFVYKRNKRGRNDFEKFERSKERRLERLDFGRP